MKIELLSNERIVAVMSDKVMTLTNSRLIVSKKKYSRSCRLEDISSIEVSFLGDIHYLLGYIISAICVSQFCLNIEDNRTSIWIVLGSCLIAFLIWWRWHRILFSVASKNGNEINIMVNAKYYKEIFDFKNQIEMERNN